ncbi:MAG TPA: copper-binding protein [Gemmataceae bacterium]|nr:copper-binding protein [Gemmataceae bacterium]
MRLLLRTAVAGIVLVLAGCSNKGNPTGQNTAKVADIKGTVVSVDPAKKTVELDHEAIPELDMKAMKMKYLVADPKLLEGLKAGDSVQGKVKAESGTYTITSLETR